MSNLYFELLNDREKVHNCAYYQQRLKFKLGKGLRISNSGFQEKQQADSLN